MLQLLQVRTPAQPASQLLLLLYPVNSALCCPAVLLLWSCVPLCAVLGLLHQLVLRINHSADGALAGLLQLT